MIVKCPQCGTGYSIPENVIGEKPKKMRCSRCKNVFTLMRRHDHAPSGYEEFTGQQHLPQEFAFLKARAPEEAPPADQAPTAFSTRRSASASGSPASSARPTSAPPSAAASRARRPATPRRWNPGIRELPRSRIPAL